MQPLSSLSRLTTSVITRKLSSRRFSQFHVCLRARGGGVTHHISKVLRTVTSHTQLEPQKLEMSPQFGKASLSFPKTP